jgi:hypothetical protein
MPGTACKRGRGSAGRVERRAWRVESGRTPTVEREMWYPQSTVPVVCASRTYRTLTTVSIVYIGTLYK